MKETNMQAEVQSDRHEYPASVRALGYILLAIASMTLVIIAVLYPNLVIP